MRKVIGTLCLVAALTGCGISPTTATAEANLRAMHASAASDSGARARQRFDRLDANKDGNVSFDEFQAARPNHPGKAPGEKTHAGKGQGFLTRLDSDKDGKISAAEFKAWASDDQAKAQKLQTAFDRFDTNKDGFLSKDDAPAKGKMERGHRGFRPGK